MEEKKGGDVEFTKQDQQRVPITTKNNDQALGTTETCADQNAQNSKNSFDRALVRWSAVVGIFTGLLFVAAGLQFCTMRGQMNVMQSQLEVMEANQRPWVFATNTAISRPIVRDEKGLNIALRFDLKNGGHSPALQTVARFRAYLRALNSTVS